MNKLTQINIGDKFLGGSVGKLGDTQYVGIYTSAMITGAISVAGIILLFLLIGGGITIISGDGKSDPKTVEMCKKTATSALIGLIVLFSAYWIVKLIETITGLKSISL